MTGPTGDAPSLSSCRRSRLGKTRMDPSFKERGGAVGGRRKDRKEKATGPSFHTSPAEGLEFGRGGERSRRKPDPEEHQRAEGLSAPPALWL